MNLTELKKNVGQLNGGVVVAGRSLNDGGLGFRRIRLSCHDPRIM